MEKIPWGDIFQQKYLERSDIPGFNNSMVVLFIYLICNEQDYAANIAKQFKNGEWDKKKVKTARDGNRVAPVLKEMNRRSLILTTDEKMARYPFYDLSEAVHSDDKVAIPYSINPDVLWSPYKVTLTPEERTQLHDAIIPNDLTWHYSDIELLMVNRRISEEIVPDCKEMLPTLSTRIENYWCNLFFMGAMNLKTKKFFEYIGNLESDNYTYNTILRAVWDFADDINRFYFNHKLIEEIEKEKLIENNKGRKLLEKINSQIEKNKIFKNYKELQDAQERALSLINQISNDRIFFKFIKPQDTMFLKVMMEGNIKREMEIENR